MGTMISHFLGFLQHTAEQLAGLAFTVLLVVLLCIWVKHLTRRHFQNKQPS